MDRDSLSTPILASPNLKDKQESGCGLLNRFAAGTVQVRIVDNRLESCCFPAGFEHSRNQ
jgi:hypothetical protein